MPDITILRAKGRTLNPTGPVIKPLPDIDSLGIPYFTFEPDFMYLDVEGTQKVRPYTYSEVASAPEGYIVVSEIRRIRSRGVAGYDIIVGPENPLGSVSDLYIFPLPDGRLTYVYSASRLVTSRLNEYLNGSTSATVVHSSFSSSIEWVEGITIGQPFDYKNSYAANTQTLQLRKAVTNFPATDIINLFETVPESLYGFSLDYGGAVTELKINTVTSVVDKSTKNYKIYGSDTLVLDANYAPDDRNTFVTTPVFNYAPYFANGFAVGNRVLSESEILDITKFYESRLTRLTSSL